VTAPTLTAGQLRRERYALRARNTRDFLRRFARHREGLLGVAILAFYVVLAVAPGLLVGPLETAVTASGGRLRPPDAQHILGTDEIGRDILNLTVHGARVSMVIGLLATLVTVFVGVVIGVLAGFIGGRTDNVLMRITDFFLVLPTFVLALIMTPVLRDVLGGGGEILGIRVSLLVIVVAIGVTSWASTARIIRSQTLSLRERAFVDRARAIGAGARHTMVHHILPNVINLVVANAVLVFAGAVLTETALSYLGLGDPFQPSWGQILNAADQAGAAGLGAWWYLVPSGASIVLVVLAFTLVGGALDDVLNPRRSGRR
jgi:peptide/nickel transport system permease protein